VICDLAVAHLDFLQQRELQRTARHARGPASFEKSGVRGMWRPQRSVRMSLYDGRRQNRAYPRKN
jgi:hypothetical protein